jgi:hypothetical protein
MLTAATALVWRMLMSARHLMSAQDMGSWFARWNNLLMWGVLAILVGFADAVLLLGWIGRAAGIH